MFGAIGLAVFSGLGCRYTHPGRWIHLPFRGHWPYLLGSNNGSCSRTNDWQLFTYFRRRIPVFIPCGIKASLCVKEDSEGLRIRVSWRKSDCMHCSTWTSLEVVIVAGPSYGQFSNSDSTRSRIGLGRLGCRCLPVHARHCQWEVLAGTSCLCLPGLNHRLSSTAVLWKIMQWPFHACL
jgi:hypothetical protein